MTTRRRTLVLCLLALGLIAAQAQDDSAPYSRVAARLIELINKDDQQAIQEMFTAEMRAALPVKKAAPFFRELVKAKGKLTEAGEPTVEGISAKLRVKAERGVWEVRISLDAQGLIAGLFVAEPLPDVPVPKRNAAAMRLPFRGEWYVLWGGDQEAVSYHVTTRNQRRAADLVVHDAAGKSHRGNGQKNEDYFAYGQEILAAARGMAVMVIDGVPDNRPGSLNAYSAVGNCLIVEQGANEFAVYAHLQPGSIKVHKGDTVAAGDVLGLCGNSGNSSEPHLHFHLQNTAALQDGTGFAPIFGRVVCQRDDKTLTETEYTFLRGDRIMTKRASQADR